MVEEIEELKSRKSFLLDRMECTEQDIPKAESRLRSMTSGMDLLQEQNHSLEAQTQADLQDYEALLQFVPNGGTTQLWKDQHQLREVHRQELLQSRKGRNESFPPLKTASRQSGP